jgi:hypothetical protein
MITQLYNNIEEHSKKRKQEIILEDDKHYKRRMQIIKMLFTVLLFGILTIGMLFCYLYNRTPNTIMEYDFFLKDKIHVINSRRLLLRAKYSQASIIDCMNYIVAFNILNNTINSFTSDNVHYKDRIEKYLVDEGLHRNWYDAIYLESDYNSVVHFNTKQVPKDSYQFQIIQSKNTSSVVCSPNALHQNKDHMKFDIQYDAVCGLLFCVTTQPLYLVKKNSEAYNRLINILNIHPKYILIYEYYPELFSKITIISTAINNKPIVIFAGTTPLSHHDLKLGTY